LDEDMIWGAMVEYINPSKEDWQKFKNILKLKRKRYFELNYKS
jgi:hypothetical protein